ncbi:endo-1,3-beta-glucanase Eng1 [Schizosaccharomyces japonicus yFS275]|uniref:glucan endo-1,3-beta-D-glucosidase n=1 Tax=Schizosaccharomyces japonicus (strain yFS275 / FY16936) TaxID=402676 RepID=B6JW94_SCHJY|nr:endo-1,3-beta-glucanase Eng1 [Schizosaccharomyces japonicus yFS275]EEB05645.1 endo-1,3-beta-glucanase Eng1 [Schizosaccharomyces japonicus yFS275]
MLVPFERLVLLSTLLSPFASASPLWSNWRNDSPSSLEKRYTDVFSVPVDTSSPASLFGSTTHPLSPGGVTADASSKPIETNKFYANILLGDRTSFIYADPLRLWWQSSSSSVSGMCVAHTDDNQRVFDTSETVPQYYFEPIGLCSLGFGATGITSTVAPEVDEIDQMSARISFEWDSSSMSMNVVSGMAYATAVYDNAVPILFSSTYYFSSVEQISFRDSAEKYRIELSNGNVWLVYVFGNALSLESTSTQVLTANDTFTGFIQIAKIPSGSATAEAVYDKHAGNYITGATVTGHTEDSKALYSLNFNTVGDLSHDPLIFGLPHHVESMISGGTVSTVQLSSLTSGAMTAIAGATWTFQETAPSDIGFLPWSPNGTAIGYSEEALIAIANAAESELTNDFSSESNLDSMYYAGKVLAKYGLLCLTINDVLADTTNGQACAVRLADALNRFVSNTQIYPLIYDETWKGVVSKAGLSGSSLSDFGNTYYNDHHFHYGYFVHAAAVLAHIYPDWLNEGNNKAYINMLIRDVSNPTSADTYFPVQRSFDFFHGHSWATGIFVSNDGKDEESTSEDYNFFYGMKLWAQVIGDSDMEQRADIILGIQRHAMGKYMLFNDGNVQPTVMQPNEIAGITFMNKIAHTTYFGTLIQYIQGIQMLPITPISAFIRQPAFVAKEWESLLASAIDSVTDGWRGILYANLAIANPTAAYSFFSQENFDTAYLDGGSCLSWYIAYAAGLSGVDAVYYPASTGSDSSTSTTTAAAVEPTTTTATAQSASSTTSSSGICNGAVYDSSLYTCESNMLCPIINGVVYKNCGGACYNADQYSCSYDSLYPADSSNTYTTTSMTTSTTPTPTPTPTETTTAAATSTNTVGVCGGSYYDSSAYTCQGNSVLCPIINSVVYLACAGACYNPSEYYCSNNALYYGTTTTTTMAAATTFATSTTTTPTPTATATSTVPTIGMCGDAYYSTESYTCYGNVLCPIIDGKALEVCGIACYDTGAYSCNEGRLIAL